MTTMFGDMINGAWTPNLILRVEVSLLDGTFTPEWGDQQWFTGDGAGYCHINGLAAGIGLGGTAPTDSYAKLMDYIVITDKDGVTKTAKEYMDENIQTNKYKGKTWQGSLKPEYAPVFVSISGGKLCIDLYQVLVAEDGSEVAGPLLNGEFALTLLAKNAAGEPLTLHTANGVVTMETDLTYGFNADGGFVKQ